MVNRVATYAFTDTMVSSNMRLQSKYADINRQIASGLKSEDYKGISGDAQYLLSLESAQGKLDAYNASGNTTLATTNIMYSTMGRIDDIANSMLSALTAAQSGVSIPGPVMAAQASNAMLEMAGLLNIKVAGRYIFSGSDIDTLPVDLADPAWAPQVTPSTFNSTYYQGNNTVNAVQVSETLTVNYGVKADNAAFEGLLRAYNLALNNPTNKIALAEASTLVKQAIDDVANVRGILSTQTKSIENQIDENSLDKTYLLEVSSNIKEVDIPSASVQLTSVQSQLEASYSASVRILNLTLVNYL
ncbi:MAG: flagellin [Pseudomonadota bacterium]